VGVRRTRPQLELHHTPAFRGGIPPQRVDNASNFHRGGPRVMLDSPGQLLLMRELLHSQPLELAPIITQSSLINAVCQKLADVLAQVAVCLPKGQDFTRRSL